MRQWKCTVCGYIHEGPEPPEVCPVCGAGRYRFILNETVPAGLETRIKQAFAAESKAHVRNQAFAQKAEEEGFSQAAHLFRAVAEAERVHAAEYLKYLEGVIGTTEENLRQAFENEIKANTQGYTPFITEALAWKREDVAWSFIRARDVEDRHAKLYKAALSAMTMDREVVYHVCQVCGYVFDGPLPDICPVCKSGRKDFKNVQ
ncbi:MAG: ferritin family protein [Pseudomonadota bacterium]